MSDFDPDAYITEKAAQKVKTAFDPDAYIEAKTAERNAQGVTVDGVPAKSDVTVETPQGPQRMVNGHPVLTHDEAQARLDAGTARMKEDAYKALLAGVQGPGSFLTDRLAGAKAAISAVPKWFKGDLGHSLGEEYARGRDSARAVVDDAVRTYPTAPLVGSLVTMPFTPVAGTGVGRVLAGGFTGGLGSFGASRGDNQLSDTLKGAGLGAGIGGTMEAAGKGARLLAGRAGQQGDLAEGVIRQNALEATESAARGAAQEASAASAEVGRKYLLAEQVLGRASATPQEKAAAQAVIDSPEVQAWLVNRQTNAVEGLVGGAKRFAELSEAASEASSGVPAAAQALGDSKIANAGQPLWMSLGRQGQRAAVGATGAALGAGVGALTNEIGLTENGKSIGGMMGALGSGMATGFVQATRNNVANPQTQLLFNRGSQSLLERLGQTAPLLGTTATQIGAESSAHTGRHPQLYEFSAPSVPPQGPQLDSTRNQIATPKASPPRLPQAPETPNRQSSPDTSEPEDEGVNALLFYGI